MCIDEYISFSNLNVLFHKINNYIYLNIIENRKKMVRAAVAKQWPGNELPNFRKLIKDARAMERLVDRLDKDCSCPRLGFNRGEIKLYLLATIKERRRDCTQVIYILPRAQ